MLINPQSIDILRYLIALRINRPLVMLPSSLTVELSYVLGTLITERLPTGQVKLWRKMQTAWEEANPLENRRKGTQKSRWPLRTPDLDWPLELAWLPYPLKHSYGREELLLCELKLFGDSASHELFLELILPTLEVAGMQGDSRWKRPYCLWGGFGVQAVYTARGKQWEEVVMDGCLDFNYRPSPNQWAEGLTFGAELGLSATRLDWLFPYQPLEVKRRFGHPPRREGLAKHNAPSLSELLLGLAARLDIVAPGWLKGEERKTVLAHLLTLAESSGMHNEWVEAVPVHSPGIVWGRQEFDPIAPALLPYLELASILHIGGRTQYGCGTFLLS